jgi:hypothetical protein
MYWCEMKEPSLYSAHLLRERRNGSTKNVPSDAQWFGNALVVEHRYAWGLAEGMQDEGLLLA